jgi:hypothetical protein
MCQLGPGTLWPQFDSFEGCPTQAQQFDNVTFQNFPTTGVSMLQFIGPGGAAARRQVIFNKVIFNNGSFQSLPVGAGNLYVTLTSRSSSG